MSVWMNVWVSVYGALLMELRPYWDGHKPDWDKAATGDECNEPYVHAYVHLVLNKQRSIQKLSSLIQ